jgi:two-component system, response regulator PdtaR
MGSSDTTEAPVVLVVEDETLVRMYVTEVIQEAGYQVAEARDGVEAIAILEARDDVKVLFTDAAMPNMNGISLARIVSDRWPQIGLVVTSGAIPPGWELDLPAGARFLQKPCGAEAIVTEIEAVLPRPGAPVDLTSLPTLQPGNVEQAGGLAQPLSEPEKK